MYGHRILKEADNEQISWWLWPNVLSLDAPVIALVWHRAFAKVFGVSWLWPVAIGLALAVWGIYLLDRLLDTAQWDAGVIVATRRHRFAQRHAGLMRVLLGMVVVAGIATVTQLSWSMILFGVVVGMGAAIYFVCFVKRRILVGCLPKEIACGLIFAIGTAGPVLLEQRAWVVFVATLFFGASCAANCVAIAVWEWEVDHAHDPIAVTHRWPMLGRHLARCLLLFMLACGLLFAVTKVSLFLAMGMSAFLLAWLHLRSLALPRERLRVLADACLLTAILCW